MVLVKLDGMIFIITFYVRRPTLFISNSIYYQIISNLPFAHFQKMMCCLNGGIPLETSMSFTTDTMNTSKLCEMCCMNKSFFKKFFF